MSYNKIVLVGNCTRDIELRYSQSGTAIANAAIATSRKFTANGEKKEEVCFVDITFFGRSAEIANQYLRKGSKILVDGRLNLDQWVDNNGQKRSKHSVIVETMQMLDSKEQNQRAEGYMQDGTQQPAHTDYQPKQPQQQPQQQGGYNQQQSYQAPTQQYGNPNKQQEPVNDIPQIDIDEDEIPF